MLWLGGETLEHELQVVTSTVRGREPDPLAVYKLLRAFGSDGYLFITDSIATPRRWNVGVAPYSTIEQWNGILRARVGGKEHVYSASNKQLDALKTAAGLSRPAANAWPGAEMFGFISFEYSYRLDRFELKSDKPAGPFPELYLQLASVTVAYDAAQQSLTVTRLAPARAACEAVMQEEADTLARHAAALPPAPEGDAAPQQPHREVLTHFTAKQSRQAYMDNVERVKHHIFEGDIFQAVLALQMEKQSKAAPVAVFDAIRRLNPSPYMFLLEFGDMALAGASPEMLVAKRGDQIYLNPIAGTVKRGNNETEDAANIAAMLGSEKEAAEHAMLVDLGRNDLGRVAKAGRVRVDDYRRVEQYSHVSHIVSRLSATLRDEFDAFDAFAAAFPAGTVSGAPKIRAMEIIHALEPSVRGPYAGAVGSFAFNGDMDTGIAIRSAFFHQGKVTVAAGAGIVADSIAANEYDECVNKMMAPAQAVLIAEQGNS